MTKSTRNSGFLVASAALPTKPILPSDSAGDSETGEDASPQARPGDVPGQDFPPLGAQGGREIAVSSTTDARKLEAAWNALANLADVAEENSISARANAAGDNGRTKVENGVLEPLRQLGLIEGEDG